MRPSLAARSRSFWQLHPQGASSLGGKAIIIQCDVADAEGMEAAAERVELELGAIEVWINAAMTSVFSFIKDMTAAEFKRVTEVCYLGYVNGTLAALKRMIPRNRASTTPHRRAIAIPRLPALGLDPAPDEPARDSAVTSPFAFLRRRRCQRSSRYDDEDVLVQIAEYNLP